MGGDGAQASQRPSQEQEKKKKDKTKDIYLSILFSIMPYDMMTTYKHSTFTIDGKQYESIWMVKPHKFVWKKGSFNKNKIDKALFIDCSELIINLDSGEVDDDEGLMELMDNAMVQVHRNLLPYREKYDKVNAHFILGADTECEDMVYAMNYVCDKTMSEKIKDHSFYSFVNNKYASYFNQYTDEGWNVKVDYCSAFEIKIIHGPMMPSKAKPSSKGNKSSKLELLDFEGDVKKSSTDNKSSDNNSNRPKLELL